MPTRRQFIRSAAAAGAFVTIMPYAARAAAHAGDTFETDGGEIVVRPVNHASLGLRTPAGTVLIDPVGDPSSYEEIGAPDLILVTHEHGDHYNAETLAALMGDDTILITNPAVHDMLPDDLKARATSIGNGERTEAVDIEIEAIPAYNITENRLNFHPEGRDNGYVLTIDGKRVYVSGDTEGVDEMRELENIDIAFVCMNLPFTMAAEQAASAVADFAPTFVYPYHYRGRDGGTQDPEEFARLLSEAGATTGVKFGEWYGEG